MEDVNSNSFICCAGREHSKKIRIYKNMNSFIECKCTNIPYLESLSIDQKQISVHYTTQGEPLLL